ncbi:TetR/AcrR family transcriptional regulator [Pedobacter sp. SYSU D00535]|uniref:TetR/AcrR family transcriptional regulator n=1 Tax=Pedobacter sp. SYSU D00535 TaxID=2810308 RepID=UPI001A97B2AC|nr:TetR/AcrR family transcriptional regulator [Pedobacter sp. SYSU D00535]
MTELKDRILKETETLFCQYGIKRITMDDIAKHLGISKKTIYQHFKDKNEIVHMVIAEMLSRETCVMDRNETESENAVHEIFLVVTHLREMLSKINPMIFFDMNKYHPATWQLFKDYRFQYMKSCVMRNMERGIAEGYFRKEINMEIMAIMRMEQVDLVFNQVAFMPGKYNLSEVLTEVTEHYLYGLCNLKGHKLVNKYKQITEE